MKSTLKNMVLVLFLITLCSSVLVGSAYKLTRIPIARTQAARIGAAIGSVLPGFDNDIVSTRRTVEIDGGTAVVFTAQKGNEPVGYAVETFTNNGFSGLITMMVGFLPDGTIHGIQVLSHAETPGLGSKIEEPDNPLASSLLGQNPAALRMSVRRDGGDVDAITASTITSRAYVEAVERAHRVWLTEVMGEQAPQTEKVDPFAVIFPGYDNDPAAERIAVNIDGKETNVFPIKKRGATLGYAVESWAKGFRSVIRMTVGFAPDGTVRHIVVTEQDETPGFGTDIVNDGNPLLSSFKGRKVGELTLKLRGKGGDIDAISGSTITSDAYIEAVGMAYRAFRQVIREGTK